jgi:hypothetical protein
LTAGFVGFAVVGRGGVGFGQYCLWFLEGFGLRTSGFFYRAVGRLGCWIWFWRFGCLMVCRLFCVLLLGGVSVLLEKSETRCKKTVDGLVEGV